jgi:ankyrin repeat protein
MKNHLHLLLVVGSIFQHGAYIGAMESADPIKEKKVLSKKEASMALINVLLDIDESEEEPDEKKLYVAVEELIDAGADIMAPYCSEYKIISKQCESYETPLMIIAAARTDDEYEAIARLLLERGAHINIVNPAGKHALLIAISKRKPALCALFLRFGAFAHINPKLITKLLKTIIDTKVKSGVRQNSSAIVCLLLRYGLIHYNAYDAHWRQVLQEITPHPLLQAVIRNDYHQIERIVGRTVGEPETTSIAQRVQRIFSRSTSHGPVMIESIDVRDERGGWTALSYAAGRGDLAMVKFLLARGANPFITDDNGMTPRAFVEWRLTMPGLTQSQLESYVRIQMALFEAEEQLLRVFTQLQHHMVMPPEIMALIASYLGVTHYPAQK